MTSYRSHVTLPVRMIAVVATIAILLSGSAGAVAADPASPPDPDLTAAREAAYLDGFDRLPLAMSPTTSEESTVQSDGASLDGHAAEPGGASDWDRIVFQSWRDSNWEVYSCDRTGGAVSRLTNNSSVDSRPSLNADLSRVAFVSERDGNTEIYSMAANGSDVRRLTNRSSRDDYPVWSPDGTKILFSTSRDGYIKLYTMNADGSNLTRITNASAYDHMPSWSAAGSRIAWVRFGNSSTGSLMIANADGSNAHAIGTSLNYVQHPVWSRDGSLIAFDADVDGDGWNELLTIKSDGTGRRTVYDLNADLTDIWMGAWSPNGAEYLISVVLYIVQDDDLYLYSTAMARVPVAGGSPFVVSGTNYDLDGDWQPPDIVAPVVTMPALPAESPASFRISWSAEDVGPSGVESYDVFYRISGAADYVKWLSNTTSNGALFIGAAGKTVDFCVQARDRAGNLSPWCTTPQATTRIESKAPVSLVQAQEWTKVDPGQMVVDASDPGGSGLKTIIIQARDLAGAQWKTISTLSAAGTFTMTGLSGHTYAVRSQATDKAGNVEALHADAGDTTTTLYTWGVSGIATDNRGRPLADVAVATNPVAFQGGTTDDTGSFSLHVSESASSWITDWSRDGYGELPPATDRTPDDLQIDVVLPPLDNVVQNWGFEAGSYGPDWSPDPAGGTPGAAAAHTGAYGAQLGSDTRSIQQVVTIPTGTTAPVLSFFYRMPATLPAGTTFDVRVDPGSGPTTLLSSSQATDGWQHSWFDLSSYTGQAVTLRFELSGSPAGEADAVWLDEITVGATEHPDTYVTPVSSQIVETSAPFTVTLPYGNRGTATAIDTPMTVTLPAGVTLLSSDPPALTSAPDLSWTVASMPPGATGQIVLVMSTDDPGPSMIELPFAIGPAFTEFAPDDNSAIVHVFVGGQQYHLPWMATQ